jgi:ABC-type polysaccharide/polyol phosphate export permease
MGRGTVVGIRQRWELVRALMGRDLALRYKGSLVGVLWSLAHPLVLGAVYTVAFQYIVRIDVPHYPLFVLAALLPWIFVSSSLSTAMGAFTEHGGLIRKVAFERDALVLARVGSELVHFVLGYGLVVVPLAVWTVGAPQALGWLPLVTALMLAQVSGLALALACWHVLVRDARHLLGVALQIWFWLTPVVYATTLVPEGWRWLVWANPMTLVADAMRGILIEGHRPGLLVLAGLLVWAVVAQVLGRRVYARLTPRLAELV